MASEVNIRFDRLPWSEGGAGGVRDPNRLMPRTTETCVHLPRPHPGAKGLDRSVVPSWQHSISDSPYRNILRSLSPTPP